MANNLFLKGKVGSHGLQVNDLFYKYRQNKKQKLEDKKLVYAVVGKQSL